MKQNSQKLIEQADKFIAEIEKLRQANPAITKEKCAHVLNIKFGTFDKYLRKYKYTWRNDYYIKLKSVKEAEIFIESLNNKELSVQEKAKKSRCKRILRIYAPKK